jgi:hypothetical protein
MSDYRCLDCIDFFHPKLKQFANQMYQFVDNVCVHAPKTECVTQMWLQDLFCEQSVSQQLFCFSCTLSLY